MCRTLTPSEFYDWLAYDELEPIGDLRGDLQSAQICATIMNHLLIRGGSYDEEKAFKPEHFLIDYEGLFKRAVEKVAATVQAPAEKWRHWKFLAKMSVAMANADERRKEKREQRIKEARERMSRREEEKALQRQQAAENRAQQRAQREEQRRLTREAREKK